MIITNCESYTVHERIHNKLFVFTNYHIHNNDRDKISVPLIPCLSKSLNKSPCSILYRLNPKLGSVRLRPPIRKSVIDMTESCFYTILNGTGINSLFVNDVCIFFLWSSLLHGWFRVEVFTREETRDRNKVY